MAILEPIRTEKLYNVIMRRITDLINEQKLEPGDRLPPERELAAALSVSRASVRQAITALSAKGILVMRQGDGNYVSNPQEKGSPLELFSRYLADSQIDPDEILEVRILVECEAVRFSALRASDAQIANMWDIIEQKKLADRQRNSVNINFNKALHFAIAEGAQNKALLSIIEMIWDFMGSNLWPLLKQESASQPNQRNLHWIHHEEIVKAITNRDPELAGKAMYNHLITIKGGIDDLMRTPARLDHIRFGEVPGD
jgi:GntR family transcriptional repressor for pyruvate dehydrogenase complex